MKIWQMYCFGKNGPITLEPIIRYGAQAKIIYKKNFGCKRNSFNRTQETSY